MFASKISINTIDDLKNHQVKLLNALQRKSVSVEEAIVANKIFENIFEILKHKERKK